MTTLTLERKRSWFLRFLESHYSYRNPKEESQEEIDAKKYIIFKWIPFNRWVLFVSAIIVQFSVGSFYAWSIYNKPIDKAIYGDENKNMTPITFFITVGVFGFSSCVMGPWVQYHGPRRGIFIGGLLFTIGHFITALGIHVKGIWLVYIGYGVVGGFGLGLSYISPVSALQKWFPDMKGLASGFSISGFGAGSLAFGKFPIYIMNSVDLVWNFIIIGSLISIIILPQSILFRDPPNGWYIPKNHKSAEIITMLKNENLFVEEKKHDKKQDEKEETKEDKSVEEGEEEDEEKEGASLEIPDNIDDNTENGDKKVNDIISNHECLKIPEVSHNIIDSLLSIEFKLMYVVFLANAIFGLIVISRLSNIVQDLFYKDKDTASMVVSVNGGFNLAGRLLFAYLSDKIGRHNCYVIALSGQIIIVGLLSVLLDSTDNYIAFIILIWIASTCYGASFGIIPAFLHDQFGPRNISATHGVILTAWSLAGVVGGIMFTEIYNRSRYDGHSVHDPINYKINFYWIISIIIVGWLVIWFLHVTVRDKFLPPIKGQLLRFRFFGKMIRISKSRGLEFVSKATEDAEWDTYIIEYNNHIKLKNDLGKDLLNEKSTNLTLDELKLPALPPTIRSTTNNPNPNLNNNNQNNTNYNNGSLNSNFSFNSKISNGDFD